MTTIFIAVLIVCIVVALFDWRRGLFACTVAALVQDPFRKLLPEEPVALTLVAAVVLAAALFSALCSGVDLRLRQIVGWNRALAKPFYLFFFLILIQAVNSLVTYENLLVTAVGLAIYLAPVPATLIGYQFAVQTGAQGVENWMRFYFVFAGLALCTVVLEYAGVSSDLFGQVGDGMKIYDLGTILIGKTGTFRSTEVAAWHAMAAACFAFILLTWKKLNNRKIIVAALIAIAMIAVAVLTGRRKSIIAFFLFATTYLFLFSLLYKDFRNWLLGIMAICATLFVILGADLDSESERRLAQAAEYQLFLERGKTVFEEAPERLLSMSVGQAEWATQATGLLGAGVGVATSGARHVGDVKWRYGGLGEGGAGKVIAELGIPGLILIAWIMLVLLRHLWCILKFAAQHSPQIFRLSAGLVAFLAANVSTYLINTQVFSDFFILIVLGLTFGFLLAMPAIVRRSSPITPEIAETASVRATARP